MVTLQVKSTDNANKDYYEPLVLRVASASKFNKERPPDRREWRFDGLDNFWQSKFPLEEGQWYKVQLATKEHGTANPYRDVVQVREATADEIPDSPPPMAQGQQNGSQGSERPKRSDGEEVFRTKEELRWTEAYHMATRIVDNEKTPDEMESYIVGWAGWFYNELANAGTPKELPDNEESNYVALEEEQRNAEPF